MLFRSNYEPTAQEKLANTNALVSALSGAIASQFLSPEEARLPFKGTTTNWGILLDDDLWKKQQEQQQQMAGGMPGQDDGSDYGGGFPGQDYGEDQPPPQGQEDDSQIAPNDVLVNKANTAA